MENFKAIVSVLSDTLETSGVIVIVLGILFFLIRFIIHLLTAKSGSFKAVKMGLGKTILLGLEILIAADIIHTVILDPTLIQVFSLGVIVLIRTFLSLSLQVEMEGKFPWQKDKIENK